MKDVKLLAQGESKVYTQHHHAEALSPAIGLIKEIPDSAYGRRESRPRLGLAFNRHDLPGIYLEPWSISSKNRVVQCYRALKLLEHVKKIQEDTLWAAYYFCARDLEVKSAHERLVNALKDTGIEDPDALRQELLDTSLTGDSDSAAIELIIKALLENDINFDFVELQQEIDLGVINRVPILNEHPVQSA